LHATRQRTGRQRQSLRTQSIELNDGEDADQYREGENNAQDGKELRPDTEVVEPIEHIETPLNFCRSPGHTAQG
jgi:hypothetical protein